MSQKAVAVLFLSVIVAFAPRLHALAVVQDSCRVVRSPGSFQLHFSFSVVNSDYPYVAGVHFIPSSTNPQCQITSYDQPPGWVGNLEPATGGVSFSASTPSDVIYRGTIKHGFGVSVSTAQYCCYNVQFTDASGHVLDTRFVCLLCTTSDVGEVPPRLESPWSGVKSLYR